MLKIVGFIALCSLDRGLVDRLEGQLCTHANQDGSQKLGANWGQLLAM